MNKSDEDNKISINFENKNNNNTFKNNIISYKEDNIVNDIISGKNKIEQIEIEKKINNDDTYEEELNNKYKEVDDFIDNEIIPRFT